MMNTEIPMDKIIPQFREVAVGWGSHFNEEIWNKVKLASDIQQASVGVMVQLLGWMKEKNITLRVGWNSLWFAEDESGNGYTQESLIKDFLKTQKEKV